MSKSVTPFLITLFLLGAPVWAAEVEDPTAPAAASATATATATAADPAPAPTREPIRETSPGTFTNTAPAAPASVVVSRPTYYTINNVEVEGDVRDVVEAALNHSKLVPDGHGRCKLVAEKPEYQVMAEAAMNLGYAEFKGMRLSLKSSTTDEQLAELLNRQGWVAQQQVYGLQQDVTQMQTDVATVKSGQATLTTRLNEQKVRLDKALYDNDKAWETQLAINEGQAKYNKENDGKIEAFGQRLSGNDQWINLFGGLFWIVVLALLVGGLLAALRFGFRLFGFIAAGVGFLLLVLLLLVIIF